MLKRDFSTVLSYEFWNIFKKIYVGEQLQTTGFNLQFGLHFTLKSDFQKVTFEKNLLYLFHRKRFKNYKKCFLFHLKSSFRSQDIYVFILTFGHVQETS